MSHPHTQQHSRRRTRAAWLLAAATTALVALAPDRAHADTYTVYSCKSPSGVWTGMAGWTSASTTPQPPGYDYGSATTCTSPSGVFSLQYGLTGLPVRNGSRVGWTFTAPPATSIASVSYNRAYSLGWPAGERTRPYALAGWFGDDVNNYLDLVAPIMSGDTVTSPTPTAKEQSNVDWPSLTLALTCSDTFGSSDCGWFPAQVTVSDAQIGLRDTSPPDPGPVPGGALVDGENLRGGASMGFSASDDGGGVYRSIVTVDGAERSRQVVDANGGACADVEPANDDPYEFGSPTPCPTTANATVTLATATLADGPHQLTVEVEDAAGNVATVYDGTITTHNGPVSTQGPALAGAVQVGQQLTASTGTWDGAPTGFTYAWLRCDGEGAACVPIDGANQAAYTPKTADAYHRLVADVTAANGNGTGEARSAPTTAVADEAGNTTPPPDTEGTPGGQHDDDDTNQPTGRTGDTTGPDGSSDQTTGSANQQPQASPPGPTQGITGLVNPLGTDAGKVANGTHASAHAHITAAFRLSNGATARRVTSVSTKRWTIAGRVTDEHGAPIGGAKLGAAWKVAGRAWHAHTGVKTDADGRFAYPLPAGPTRSVELTYFAFSDSRTVLKSNVVTEAVRAPLTIRVDHHAVTGKRVVKLSGTVGGGSIPARGVLVTLQGFQKGFGWRTFKTVRTTHAGRWATSYRFRLAHGRFAFRALVPQQGTYPYVTTYSKAVAVTVS